jgi:hypothetical protein
LAVDTLPDALKSVADRLRTRLPDVLLWPLVAVDRVAADWTKAYSGAASAVDRGDDSVAEPAEEVGLQYALESALVGLVCALAMCVQLSLFSSSLGLAAN